MNTEVIANSDAEAKWKRVQTPRREVLMLGTSPDTKGGVASVIKMYRSGGLFAQWPVTYLATHSDGGPGRKFSMAISAWIRFAARLVKRQDFLLHVHSASHASFWRKSAFILPAVWAGKSVIFHLHGGGFLRFYEEECGSLAKWMVRYVLHRCSKIVVLSNSWRDAIATITNNRVSVDVVSNLATAFPRASASAMRRSGTLLFLGRLGEAKGIYVLLNALPRVSRRHPDVRLICAGDGDVEAVRRAAKDLGLEDRVEILGWIDEARRCELLATASLYVLPSFAEGMPMSILEAMSAGLPVVATPVGGIPDAITDGKEGCLVPAGNAMALSEAICKLLADSELREAMGSRGRATFNARFDSTVVLPEVGRIYRDLGVLPVEKPVRAAPASQFEPADSKVRSERLGTG